MARNPPSLKLRQQNGNFTKRESKKDSRKSSVPQQPKKLASFKKSDSDMYNLLYPSIETAWKALILVRFIASIWSHVTDCDETYNYWEPTHYLLYGKGLQTWEYSPEYALRSYTYLLLHGLPAIIYQKLLSPEPYVIFYFVRVLLGLFCTAMEVSFYKAVCREFGVHIGRVCLVFQCFSAGMFISSASYLPSSFAMYMCLLACSSWWLQKYELAIFATALGSLLGWPFAALLGLPIVIDMLFLKRLHKTFLKWTLISGIVVLIPMVIIDSITYGKLVIAPLNIIKYNIFGGAGPNLYGTEPLSYYLINGFLNFNFIWIFALLTPIMLILMHFFIPTKQRSTLQLPDYLSISPLYLWLLVFFFQPHKEERFLYPVYPLICLCGAITVDTIQKLYFRITSSIRKSQKGSHYLDHTTFIMIIVLIVTSAMGLSRIYSLYANYHAPLDVMIDLNKHSHESKIPDGMNVNVCMGKDWHRYPSSFFLPNPNWNLRFVKSEFKGILPAPYTEAENGTKVVHAHFNDQNREEPSLYFDISKCHFLIDLDVGRETPLEPNYAKRKEQWKTLKSYPFLDTENSHRFFRAFYIPYYTNKYVKYGNLVLLRVIKSKNSQV